MLTPYYSDADVTIYHGDAREVLAGVDIQAAAAVADPPYGVTAHPWDRWPKDWPSWLIGHTNALWCWGSMRVFLEHQQEFRDWSYAQEIVWRKANGTNLATDRFRRVHELCVQFYRGGWGDLRHVTPKVKGKPYHRITKAARQHFNTYGQIQRTNSGTRLVQSVLTARSPRCTKGHPTMKPEGILSHIIGFSVEPGGIVLDPFAGGGGTLVAARGIGRRAVGIESDERYCEMAARRLQALPLIVGETA